MLSDRFAVPPKDTTGLSRGVSCLLLNRIQSEGPDATGLPRGASRLLLFSFEREPPRHKAVASSPPNKKHRCSNQRDSPRDKPVASSTFCAKPVGARLEALRPAGIHSLQDA